MNDYKIIIEKELRKFFSLKKKESKNISPEIYEAVSNLEEFTLRGGKRIRSILIIIAYLASGGKKVKDIVKVSTSAELLHSFFLVHDDIMDQDDIRRNGPTMHKSYKKDYNERAAESIAITIGDLSFAYAMEILANSTFSGEKKAHALNELTNIVKHTCYGQMLDIIGETKKVDEVFIRKIHEYKTAKYTISGPLVLGAKLAGASQKIIKQYNSFGTLLGKAFQVQDDVLGVFGDEKKLGKPIGSDLIEGKKTLLIVKAKSDYINKKIGKNLTKNEINKIRNIIIETGSLDYSQKVIRKLLIDAKNILVGMKIRKKEKEYLMRLADYLERRTS